MKKMNYIFITVIIIFLAGCYTVLQHPDVVNTDENGNSYYGQVDYSSDCMKCHANAHTEVAYDYNRYNSYYYQNVNNPDPGPQSWIGYYQIPWWYSPSGNVTRIINNGGGIPANNSGGNSQTTAGKPEIRNTGSTRDNTPASTPTPVIVRDSRSGGSSSTTVNTSATDARHSGSSSGRTSTNTTSTTNTDSSTGKTSTDKSSDRSSDNRGSTTTNNNNSNNNNSGNSGNSNSNSDSNKRTSGSTRGRN
jgi:hypothetical protein